MVKHPKKRKRDRKDASSQGRDSSSPPSDEMAEKGKDEQGEYDKASAEKKEEQGGAEPDRPPTEPPVDKSEALKSSQNPINRIFWMRVALGVLAGALAAQIGFTLEVGERIGLGIGSAIVFFIVSVVIAKAMRIPLPSSDRKKLVTTGMGSYVGMFLFVWILSHTIMHQMSPKAFGPAVANVMAVSLGTLWYDVVVPNLSYLLLY